jgi:chorismate synthase
VKLEGITIRDLQSPADFDACFQLQADTWGADYAELVPRSVLRLAQKLGGVAAGAFEEGGRMVGLVFGIPGVEDRALVHWSDMLAVRPEIQNRGLGEALKRYQRAVLLERGVRRMYWSFDPLEARNAYFNFVRLGATACEYTRDFYGESKSPLHQGLGTDRLIVRWDLASARVKARLNGEPVVTIGSAEVVNPTVSRAGLPHSSPPRLDEADAVRIAVPASIQNLKKQDPAIAREWRAHTRAAFEFYLAKGLIVVDFERLPEGGTYMLTRELDLLS